MKIEEIIYDTAREVFNVEDKISIATVFLFCMQRDDRLFAELLHTDDHRGFVERLNAEYAKYDVDFSIRFDNANVHRSFRRTVEKVRQVYDRDGFYKALSEKDEYALAVHEILNFDFKGAMPKDLKAKVSRQLAFQFQ